MSNDICVRRLTKELKAIKKDPIKEPKMTVEPNEANMLEIHYVIEGSKGSVYEGGVYHGKLIFPKEYPLRPPGVMMLTPSGRFQTNRRLCLSMSDFHPESWNPMWSVSTILTGLYSFMIESNPTLGSIETSTRKKRQLAEQSLAYNVKNDKMFCKLFPQYVERYQREEEERKQKAAAVSAAMFSLPSSSSSPAHHPRAGGGGERWGLMNIPAAAQVAGILALSLSIAVALSRFI